MSRIGGAAVSDHLAVVRRRRGTPEAVEKPPPLPDAARFAWGAFVDLSAARQVNMALQPIGYGDIVAYQHATRRTLTGWDADQIRALDDLYLKTVAEAEKRKRPHQK